MIHRASWIIPQYPLVMSKSLLEMAIEIVDLPIKNGDLAIIDHIPNGI